MARKFANKTPIDDDMTVLDLLCRSWQDSTDRVIKTWKGQEPYVEIGVYSSGYTREEWTCGYYFLITPGVIARLIASRYVNGKMEWGYTDMHQLRISEAGERVYWDRRKDVSPEKPGNPLRASDWFLGERDV